MVVDTAVAGEADALAALDRIDARDGTLRVASSKITEAELKNIELALMHPPTRVNWATAISSVLSASYVAVKTLHGGAVDVDGVAVFSMSLLVIGGVAATTWKQYTQKHPHHDRALEDVRKLLGKNSNA